MFEEIGAEDIKFTGFSQEELDNLFDEGLPEWGDTEEGTEEKDAKEDEEPKVETPEKPAALKEFNIFLSFPTKEAAEKWLKDRGVDIEYQGTARNITIRMEGLDYGTGN